jgi:uncharacterized FAD-dependent dehydrogenase
MTAKQAGIVVDSIRSLRLVRRSIDARGRKPLVRLAVDVFVGEDPPVATPLVKSLKPAKADRRVVIIGAGPAGYFAALELLKYGVTPIVLDRGKDVRERRRDLRAIQQDGVVDPDSNYCFGEGGAGTYSDGKLYTRSHKRGDVDKVLHLLVEHGANPDILIDAHPHIGSNKLWTVVQAMRETIQRLGGEVHFHSRVVDFVIDHAPTKKITGVVLENGDLVEGQAVILATGHSARDIFHLCVQRGVDVEAKSFAMGVRIEHPQELIDEIRYRQRPREKFLPAASYSVVCQVDGRGVFSFCMCPGGLIVPSATAPGEMVVNGMSMSRRDSAYANSGTVVAIEEEDWAHLTNEHGPLAAMEYQAQMERAAWTANGDGSQKAPAQRLGDYLNHTVSSTLPANSYIPGLVSADIKSIIPPVIDRRLREAIVQFNKPVPGYITNEAVIVGVESRTSSPVRIPRDPQTYAHTTVERLYPCGEGAGYAGGIMSAALDGQNVARAIAETIFSETVRPDAAAPFM